MELIEGLSPEEINKTFSLSPRFRGTQIFKWVMRGASSFDEMTDLPPALRHELAKKARLRSLTISNVLRDADGTVKFQLAADDGCMIEAVLLADKAKRKTACLSTQAGCAMGCAFCMTGTLGLSRNLTAAEIVCQFLLLEKECGAIDSLVFMGMGEPLLNLDALLKSVALLSDARGRNFSPRRITVSTVGIARGIYELAEKGSNLRLALSLTSADEKTRASLVPPARDNPLAELKKALVYYNEKSGRRITLEAVLLSGVNTDGASAEKLADFAKGLSANVNLIPWNAVETLPFSPPAREEVDSFKAALEGAGLNVSVRQPRGKNIAGACGQLGAVKPA